MQITSVTVKELREATGAGILEWKNTLLETNGDLAKATTILKQKGFNIAEKKAQREVTQGTIDTYVHSGNRIGAIVEIKCESDFVARTEEFRQLAQDIAMQVAAMDPKYLSRDDLPPEVDLDPREVCLLEQAFIKLPEKTIQDIIVDTIAKFGENIKMGRFVRFALDS